MNNNYHIRTVREEDVELILDIYGPYVKGSNISFEYEVPSRETFRERIISNSSLYPWLVCVYNDKLAGYAYAGKHRERSAYQWSCDSSIYLLPKFQGKGIGRILYEALFNILRLQGYYNVFAGIGLPNDTSVAFHKKLGFEVIGIYRNVGYKHNNWIDTMWLQLGITPFNDHPLTPKIFTEITTSIPFISIMEVANKNTN